MAGTFLRNFIKIGLVISEKKMYNEKVNKNHGRNISEKFHQNLISSFREEDV